MMQVVQMMDGLGDQGAAADAMPGGFAPPARDEDGEDYESDTTDDADAGPGAIGALANAMRGWWGNEAGAPDEQVD